MPREIKNQRKIDEKAFQKKVQKLTSFFIDFSSIFALKIDPKIDKNSIKKLTKTRYEKRTEKMRKRAQHEPTCASKPDLARETESADWSRWLRAAISCELKFLMQKL